MTDLFAPLLDETLLIAHGGASAHVTGNTEEAFQVALRLGASGLQGDLWSTADGRGVLHTGSSTGGRLRKRQIAAQSRADLGTEVLGVDELYRRCGSDFELSLDIRDVAGFATVIEAAEGVDALDRLWVNHDQIELLAEWSALHPGPRYIHAAHLEGLPQGAERHAARLRELGIAGVSLPHSDWTAGHVALFHRFGRFAMAWQPDHVRQIVALLGQGIDGVVCDHVDRMTEARDQLG